MMEYIGIINFATTVIIIPLAKVIYNQHKIIENANNKIDLLTEEVRLLRKIVIEIADESALKKHLLQK
jgi:hypothetical protein